MDPFFFSLVAGQKESQSRWFTTLLLLSVLFCRSTFDSKADTLETLGMDFRIRVPLRSPNFLCPLILSFFRSICRLFPIRVLYDWYIDSYIYIYISYRRVLSSSIRISWYDIQYESMYRVPLTRFISFSISFSFFPLLLFFFPLPLVFSRENPLNRKLSRVISFDQVVTTSIELNISDCNQSTFHFIRNEIQFSRNNWISRRSRDKY